MADYSKNERAGRVMGLRSKAIAIQEPSELGYRCPVCKNSPRLPSGEPDPRLTWSEYQGFIWCKVCDCDYPSCLCLGDDVGASIEIFLDSVEDAICRFIERVNKRAEMNMERTGKLEGAHYAAMQVELENLKGDI